MLIAHALFKSTLFLVVGVDRPLAPAPATSASCPGWRRSLPVVAVIGGLAAASMAGLPPTLGFIAKEAALEA